MRYFKYLFLAASLFIGVLSAGFAHAASIIIAYAGNNTFIVSGSGLSGVCALDLTIDYDSAVLGNPRTIAGPLSKNAMFVANPNTPGRISIGLATTTPISGNGTLGTITFDNNGSGAGQILALSVEASDCTPAHLPIAAVVGAQPVAAADSSGVNNPNPASLQNSPSTATEGTVPVRTGTGEYQPGGEGVKNPSQPAPAPESLPAVPAATEQQDRRNSPADAGSAGSSSAPEEKITWNPPVIKSVINRFRDFQGEMTPKNLLALFSEDNTTAVRQEPVVVLSDGTSQVTVYIDLPNSRQTPNFSVNGAKLVSIKRDDAGIWAFKILPDKNGSEATISVLSGDRSLVVPVTVGPPVADLLANKVKLNEAAFSLFLKERGTAKAPRGDLNNDGRRDYVDDFIYACNFLVLTNSSMRKESGR